MKPRYQQYLASPARLSPLAGLLAILYLYLFFKAGPPHGSIVVGVVLFLCLIAMKARRWLVHAFILCAMVGLVAWGVFRDAQGPHDLRSDRDDAVESATAAFLDGQNPWSHRSPLNLPIRTGPSSILLALPFVAATGKVDALTFLAWCTFLAGLAMADIWRRNDSLSTLALLLLFPWMGFLHTLHWGLDELCYAAILSPGLWFALERRRFFLAGLFGGFMVLSRLSYAPAVMAAGLWWLFKEWRTLRDVLCLALGGGAYVGGILALMWWVGGGAFLQENFWLNSPMRPLDYGGNPVAQAVSSLLRILPQGTPGGMMLVLACTLLAAWPLRRLDHPFFHMAIALLLAHLIPFSPKYPMDYQMLVMVPALYGVAFSAAAAPEPARAPPASG